MGFSSGLLPDSNRWGLHRKLFNTALNPKKLAYQYPPLAISKPRQNLLDPPDASCSPLQLEDVSCLYCLYVGWRRLTMCSFAAGTMMSAAYGYDVLSKDGPFLAKVEHFIGLFIKALAPERAALFLAFPFCMSNRLRCCIAPLIVDVISGPYSILAAGRSIQVKIRGMSCAHRGSVNQPG